MPTVLQASGLVKRYGGFTAVDGVEFSIGAGEILGLLGPNGAGKSTIVKILTGLVEPTTGAILFDGVPVRDQVLEFKRSFGYVPEQPDLYGFLSGWEYLEMVATLRELDRGAFRVKASAMLEGFSLYPSRDLPISAYSKGMRQRIVVIAALLHDPRLLILDEPFSGLDVTSALILRRVISLLAASGKAVLFSSPVLEQADRLCTHLALLRRGRVAAAGPIDEVREGFAGLDLESGFLQLTEPVDVEHHAESIVAAATAH